MLFGIVACLSLGNPIHAGTYTWTKTDAAGNVTARSPTFSGGQWYGIYHTPNIPLPYNTWANGTGTGDSSGQTDSLGTLTATFTWQPAAGQSLTTDPPPQCIITQTSVANYYQNGFASLPATVCTDGLGDPEVGTKGVNGRSQGTRYSVVSPSGSTVTVTLTGARAKIDPANEGRYPSLSSGVQWTVSASPVILTLGGTTKVNGSDNILIGQGCTGNISAGPFTLSKFQWSVSGETFKSFVMGTTPGTLLTNPKPYGRVNYLTSADTTSPNPQWFWKKGADFGAPQTVSCTATASINGTAIGTVIGSKTVSVWQPYNFFGPNAGGVSLTGTATPDQSILGHITWVGAVGTPDLFASYWGTKGIWQFTQICNISNTLRVSVNLFL